LHELTIVVITLADAEVLFVQTAFDRCRQKNETFFLCYNTLAAGRKVLQCRLTSTKFHRATID